MTRQWLVNFHVTVWFVHRRTRHCALVYQHILSEKLPAALVSLGNANDPVDCTLFCMN